MRPEELEELPLFEGLAPEYNVYLAPLFTYAEFAAGHLLFAQGDRAETVFVIERGEVRLGFRPEDGGWLTIATVRPGGLVGWSAVLGRRRYTSSAECLTEVAAAVIQGDELRAMIRAQPRLGTILVGRMASSVAARWAGAEAQVKSLIHRELAHADGQGVLQAPAG